MATLSDMESDVCDIATWRSSATTSLTISRTS